MNSTTTIHLVECPRDAMQGWKAFIPTERKIQYLQELLKVGFHTLDFGSFVSSKAIPQMADTHHVIAELEKGFRDGSIPRSGTRLLSIIANRRGAEEALQYPSIHYLGFPFSVSPTFQQRNTNSTIEESLGRVSEIQKLCVDHGRELVVYISMAFGNPYGDPYNEETVFKWVNQLASMNIQTLSLADTVGLARPDQVYKLTSYLVKQLPRNTIGVHLHSSAAKWKEKIDAALEAGCYRFDGALKGIGGCPMADDELVGNMNSEWMIPYFQSLGRMATLNGPALQKCIEMAGEIFN